MEYHRVLMDFISAKAMTLKDNIQKKEGFPGEKAIVIPETILQHQCSRQPVSSHLYVTDIGYYPKAQYHYRERLQGSDQHILLYCTEGNGTVTIRQTEYMLAAGECIIIPRHLPHTYAASDKQPWTIYWLHFKGKAADDIVIQFVQRSYYKVSVNPRTKSLELFDEIYYQLARGYGSDTLAYANMCLWHFLGTLLLNSQLPGRPVNSQGPADKVIDFFSSHIDKALSLEEIAAEAGLSPAHFSVVFKKKTGFSPIEYFNHLKIQKACQYLLFTEMLIKEIASEVGIADPYYFSRLFTRIMGISPNKYREHGMQ